MTSRRGGPSPVAGSVAIAAAAVLAVRGRSAELGYLLAGVAVLYLTVHAIRGGVGRERPH